MARTIQPFEYLIEASKHWRPICGIALNLNSFFQDSFEIFSTYRFLLSFLSIHLCTQIPDFAGRVLLGKHSAKDLGEGVFISKGDDIYSCFSCAVIDSFLLAEQVVHPGATPSTQLKIPKVWARWRAQELGRNPGDWCVGNPGRPIRNPETRKSGKPFKGWYSPRVPEGHGKGLPPSPFPSCLHLLAEDAHGLNPTKHLRKSKAGKLKEVVVTRLNVVMLCVCSRMGRWGRRIVNFRLAWGVYSDHVSKEIKYLASVN